MKIGEKVCFFGHCTGILPDGEEIPNYSEYTTVNNGRLVKGRRPKKGGLYKLDGRPVRCIQSAFGEGDADYPDTWSYTLDFA